MKSMHGRFRSGVSCFLALLLSCSAATAEDQPTLDELLDLVPVDATDQPPEETTGTADASAGFDEVPTTDGVEERLSGEQAADAFAQAIDDMGAVAKRLGEADDPGLDTQRLQESILARLDQIIEAAEQQSSSSSGGGGGSPSGQQSNQDSGAQNAGQQQPGQQPGQGQQAGLTPGRGGENPGNFSPGAVGPVNPAQGAIEELRSEWGALPPRLRDELTNGLDEPFSPVYRRLTEAYYRRLAEEAE